MNFALQQSRLLKRGAHGAVWLIVACLPALVTAQQTNTPAAVFQSLADDRWVSREVTFAELGFTGPLVLGAPETRREIYLPVPASVPLSGGEIRLDANYMRADGGRTSLILSLDASPVSSRPFALEKGDASLVLAVDGAPRPSGFVRLSVDWRTALGADWFCTDGRTPGNVLRIEPGSRFTYRYDGDAIRDLTTAWGALPSVPVILISSKSLSSEAYDSAWRLGSSLERVGKRSSIRALPAVGDVVDLRAVEIPSGLRSVPAFAALDHRGMHKLANAAEVGALLALGQRGPFRADLMISDAAMKTSLNAAFDALSNQVQTVAPAAVAAFADWRLRALDPLARAPASRQIELAHAFGAPLIVVASDAGAQAAGLFSAYWNRLAVAAVMGVQAAGQPDNDSSLISLSYLGGKPGSFDVLAHADWSASFDIGTVAADGRLPGSLVLDIAAAPSAASTPPVLSIFMNDILLGARQLDADGKRERITASIPRYSLLAQNTLRLSFVRQLASDRCRETPEAYPVSVLPSSHLLLKKADASDAFIGMVSRYATGAHVMVPAAYLEDAVSTLPRVIRMAATTGVSPRQASFTAVVAGETEDPDGPFLGLELPFKGAKSRVKLDNGRLVMSADNDHVILDVTGLNNVGVVEIVEVGGNRGVVYRSVGAEPPAMDKPIMLAQGDVAVLGPNGLLAELNSANPSGRGLLIEESETKDPWLLRGNYWWALPILFVVFMLMLMVGASRMRRREGARAPA